MVKNYQYDGKGVKSDPRGKISAGVREMSPRDGHINALDDPIFNLCRIETGGMSSIFLLFFSSSGATKNFI